MRKILTLALLAVLALTLLSGCKNTTVKLDPIIVLDPTGASVTLENPATKVVALTAADAEIIYALGAGDTLVGRGEYCDWPAEIIDIPSVQSGAETNIEQIIELAPQIVFMSKMAQSPVHAEQLRAAGIQVYSSDAQTIEETYTSIINIGLLMGKNEEATGIVSEMKAVFAEISQAPLTGSIYFEVSPLEFGLWAGGRGTFMNEIAELIGLTNIFADVDGWAEISEEQILERNPDYIVTVGMYFGDGLLPDQEILARTAWQGVTAVQKSQVINIADNSMARPGPRLADGAKTLYNFVLEKQAESAA